MLSEEPRDDQVAEILQALANPVRMQLLRILKTPHALGEIRLAPRRKESGGTPARLMSRVTVRQHLDKLLAVGAVKALDTTRDGRRTTLYQLNHRQLFALNEELKELARMRAPLEILDGTQPAPAAPMPRQEHPAAPALVAMNGVHEGRIWPLDSSKKAWTIGRRRQADICLDYDPYLSQENSEIRLDGRRLVVHDLPGNRNGTRVNWLPLPAGGSSPLRAGDVVGVGRSLLLVRDAP